MADKTLIPAVTWAQRTDVIFLTIEIQDCQSPEITIDADKVHFKGTGGPDKKLYEITIDLCKEVVPDDSKYHIGARGIEFLLRKKEDGPYWPSLLKTKAKQHWLKIDFSKWKDEDDSDVEEAGGQPDFDTMLKQMGGLGDMKPTLDDVEVPDSDSDDDQMPDLE